MMQACGGADVFSDPLLEEQALTDQRSVNEKSMARATGRWHALPWRRRGMNPSEEMALAIGRMTMAWSRVHFSLYELLIYISGLDEREAKRIEFFRRWEDWHKREVVKKAFVACLGSTHPLSLRLATTLERCRVLADKRNAFIHTPLFEVEHVARVEPLGGFHPGEVWDRSPSDRYQIKSHALAECLELQCEIQEVEDAIDELIDEAIVALMTAQAAAS
jgi:hypothetical protein